jgi:hypothetical protein
MTQLKIFIYGCLFLSLLAICGCETTSSELGTGACSGYSSGPGYTINVCVSKTILPQGGSAVVTAYVKDAQGNPVNDSSRGVTFASEWGGTFSTNSSINLGTCSVTYTAPGAGSTTQPSTIVDRITAGYQGAVAWVSVEVYKP